MKEDGNEKESSKGSNECQAPVDGNTYEPQSDAQDDAQIEAWRELVRSHTQAMKEFSAAQAQNSTSAKDGKQGKPAWQPHEAPESLESQFYRTPGFAQIKVRTVTLTFQIPADVPHSDKELEKILEEEFIRDALNPAVNRIRVQKWENGNSSTIVLVP